MYLKIKFKFLISNLKLSPPPPHITQFSPRTNEFAATGWKFGLGVCLTYLSIDYTASTASIFNLFILSLDR